MSAWSDAWVGHTKRQVRGPSSQVLVRGREQLATGRPVCEDKDQVGFYWSSSWGMEMASFSLENVCTFSPGLCPTRALAQTLAGLQAPLCDNELLP